MSVRSLTNLAVERDIAAATPDTTKAKRTIRTQDGKAVAADQRARDALISAIPTEVLAAYTFLVTEFVGAVDKPTTANPHPNALLGQRWSLYAGGLLFTAVSILAAYQSKKTKTKNRRIPFAEMLAGAIAFAVWGLAMPGSPLIVKMTSPSNKLWPLTLTVVGGALLGLLTGLLRTQSRLRR